MITLQKSTIEELLRNEIPEDLFKRALESATNKQKRIYALYGHEYVMQEWYLIQLTKEAVIEISFSQLTMELCSALNDMKKERLCPTGISTPTATHIVTAIS